MELLIGMGILISVLVLTIVVVVPPLVLRALAPSLERRIAQTYAADEIVLRDLKAVTFGRQSRGVRQGRGNGGLVLTAAELGWFRFVPEKSDLRIPRAHITRVDTVKTHLGKTYGRDLLSVTFTTDGTSDVIAWYVTDLGAWLAALGGPAPTV
jgi:hypothetical protein